MARYAPPHDAPPIIEIAQRWVRDSLVEDRSMLGTQPISTVANFDALDAYFVQRPDAGSGSFYEKLRGQMEGAPPAACKLMAEVLWALFLFPSNIGADTKREGVLRVWGWSGDQLDGSHPLLADALLEGIGSAGMGVNTNRWRELSYLIGLARSVKQVAPAQRSALFSSYDRYMEWVATVPQEGDRQFRHMLRYFLFPDQVERMSSNGDRRRVLAAFGVAEQRVTRKWSDRQLDEALSNLRRKLEEKYETADLDFYVPPLREEWQSPNELEVANEDPPVVQVEEPRPNYPRSATAARNLILYGPPGTGKTWRMQQMFSSYTDQPADLDRTTWELQLVARYGWRACIAAALALLDTPTKANELEMHPLVRAKAAQRKRSGSVRSTLWGYMQEHTTLDSKTVNVATRRAPYIFDKNVESAWLLVPDWQEQDAEAVDLLEAWRAGPDSDAVPVKRYRLVTFHPSYSYEDFVIGLRPVAAGGDGGATANFQLVDGVFKQACEEARANPSKRYALFIDEINRANIAKVFGELITLIEPDKRARYDSEGMLIAGLEVQLPGTGVEDAADERFGVPENLDIIGTMNTADRSIALLDIALRRRFEFREVPPEYGLLDRRVEGVDLGRLLSMINDRLEFLADRDRLIGHAYFTRVRSLDDLRQVFTSQVIPLLQEFFFDDWSRVQLVLATGGGRSAFIEQERMDGASLFRSSKLAHVERERYKVTPPNGWVADDFRRLYGENTQDGAAVG